MGGLRDPNPPAPPDLAYGPVRRAQRDLRVTEEVAPIQAAVNIQRLREPTGAATQEAQLFDAPALAHQCDALARLKRANEYRRSGPVRFARNVEAPVHSINVVDIGVKRRPEHRDISRTLPAIRMRRRVADQVCFGLYDATAGAALTRTTNQTPTNECTC